MLAQMRRTCSKVLLHFSKVPEKHGEYVGGTSEIVAVLLCAYSIEMNILLWELWEKVFFQALLCLSVGTLWQEEDRSMHGGGGAL